VNDELERIWKEASYPNFELLSKQLPGGTEEKRKHRSQYRRSLWRDLNAGTSDSGAGVLTTRP
jgi:hypothetical protein